MTPARFIAALDRQIAAHGQAVTLSRVVVDDDPIEHAIRGRVRFKGESDLTAEITVGSYDIVVSPSALVGTPFADGFERETDAVIVDATFRQIQIAVSMSLAGTTVRHNLTVT